MKKNVYVQLSISLTMKKMKCTSVQISLCRGNSPRPAPQVGLRSPNPDWEDGSDSTLCWFGRPGTPGKHRGDLIPAGESEEALGWGRVTGTRAQSPEAVRD